MNTKTVDCDFILKVLQITSTYDCKDIYWRTHGEYAPVSFFINCSDIFFWACADDEELTPDNLEVFKQSYADTENLHESGKIYADILFCARMRKMRPQGAYYNFIPNELWPLFDACGPEREIDMGNPFKPGEKMEGE